MSTAKLSDLFHIFRKNCRYFLKMSARPAMENIKQNAEVAKQSISNLKSELSVINREYNQMRLKQLREENVKLLAAIDDCKKRLVQVEIKNGVKQIPLPNQVKCTIPPNEPKVKQEQPAPLENNAKSPPKEAKPKKEKKQPKEKEPAVPELPMDVGRLDLRIGKVEDVQRHPDADSLYLLKIDCGEERARTVCSGLVKHVPMQELQDALVLLLCNLKPVKMRGVTSEAMVMCASSDRSVEVLIPPPGCAAGDLVHCAGFTRQPDALMNPKKKIFETVAPDLHTNEFQQACYRGVPLAVQGKGFFVSKTLINVPVK